MSKVQALENSYRGMPSSNRKNFQLIRQDARDPSRRPCRLDFIEEIYWYSTYHFATMRLSAAAHSLDFVAATMTSKSATLSMANVTFPIPSSSPPLNLLDDPPFCVPPLQYPDSVGPISANNCRGALDLSLEGKFVPAPLLNNWELPVRSAFSTFLVAVER